MVNQIKQIIQGADNASAPCTFMFGTVISEQPFQVQVDNRFIIGSSALVRLKQQTSGAYSTHTHRVKISGIEYTTEEEHENYAGLKTGDKLALLRERGGQRYLVLGVIE
jgi:hypothetical protein